LQTVFYLLSCNLLKKNINIVKAFCLKIKNKTKLFRQTEG
jgi:hypothetical protein